MPGESNSRPEASHDWVITNRAADREAMGEKQLVFAIGFYDKFLAFQHTKNQFSLSLHIF